MPHQVRLRTLGRTTAHRLSMLRNLAVAVLRYERVKTTEAKAKEVRRFVDKAINLGREGSLVTRRRARALLRDPLIVEKVFEELGKRYADRASGFTRLVRLGHRVGDGAPMMLVELIESAMPARAAEAPERTEEEAPKGPAAAARELARRVTRRGGAEKEAAEPEAKTRPAKPRAAQKEAARPGEALPPGRPPQKPKAKSEGSSDEAKPKKRAKASPDEKAKARSTARQRKKD